MGGGGTSWGSGRKKERGVEGLGKEAQNRERMESYTCHLPPQ